MRKKQQSSPLISNAFIENVSNILGLEPLPKKPGKGSIILCFMPLGIIEILIFGGRFFVHTEDAPVLLNILFCILAGFSSGYGTRRMTKWYFRKREAYYKAFTERLTEIKSFFDSPNFPYLSTTDGTTFRKK